MMYKQATRQRSRCQAFKYVCLAMCSSASWGLYTNSKSLADDEASAVTSESGRVGPQLKSTDSPNVPIDPEVVAAWQHNAQAVMVLAVKYEVQRSTDLPKTEVIEIGQFAEGADFFLPETVDLYKSGVKFSCRRDHWVTDNGRKTATYRFYKCDGRDFFLVKDDQGSFPVVVAFPLEQLGGRADCEMEYLERAGFYRNPTPAPDQALVDIVMRNGTVTAASYGQLNGRRAFTVTVRTPKEIHTFHFDPSIRYALRRHDVAMASDAPIRVTTNDNFEHFTSPDIWLPHNCTTVWHTWSSMGSGLHDTPLFTETLKVSRISTSPLADDLFTAEMQRPGTLVADGRLPGANKHPQGLVQYQVPADLKHLEGVVMAAIDGKPYQPSARSTTLFKVVIILNVLLFGGGAVVAWRKRRTAQ